jgi:hypothetical protein
VNENAKRNITAFHQLHCCGFLSIMQVVSSLDRALLATTLCIMLTDCRIIVELPSEEGRQDALVGREKHAANADDVFFHKWQLAGFHSFSRNRNWALVSTFNISKINPAHINLEG